MLKGSLAVFSVATMGCTSLNSPSVNHTASDPAPRLESKAHVTSTLPVLVDFQLEPGTRGKKPIIITFVIKNNTQSPFAFCPYVFKYGPDGKDILPDHGVYFDPANPLEYPKPTDIVILRPKDSFSFQIPRHEMVAFPMLVGRTFFYESPDLRKLSSEYRHAQEIKDLLNTQGIKSGRIYVESRLRE